MPEISAYFEALEHYISSVGWVLLQVNAEGIIESCTQNIRELIGYEKQELYRRPLYMYLYPGDHAKLDPIINNMSSTFSTNNVGGGMGVGVGGNNANHNVGGGGMSDINSGWGLGDTDEHNGGSSGGGAAGKPKRSISTKVRMLVKDMRSSTQTSGGSTTTTTNNNDSNNMDQKPKYEEVVLIAAPVKGKWEKMSSI